LELLLPNVIKKATKAPKSLTPSGERIHVVLMKRQLNQRKFAESTLEKRRLEALQGKPRVPTPEQQDASPEQPSPSSKPDQQ